MKPFVPEGALNLLLIKAFVGTNICIFYLELSFVFSVIGLSLCLCNMWFG